VPKSDGSASAAWAHSILPVEGAQLGSALAASSGLKALPLMEAAVAGVSLEWNDVLFLHLCLHPVDALFLFLTAAAVFTFLLISMGLWGSLCEAVFVANASASDTNILQLLY
jgi:hypothetical protein